MKKIISLILSIALLATLMPTMLVSADNTADTQAIMITEDTSLVAKLIDGSYGMYCYGDAALIEWNAFNSTFGAYLLHKIPVSNINVPDGKMIAKIELSFSRAYDTSKSGYYSAGVDATPVNFYVASSDWDESTTYIKKWCPLVTPDTTLKPTMVWDSSSKFGIIESASDLSCTANLTTLSTSVPSQKLSFDITSLYKKAADSKMLSSNGDFSVITKVGNSDLWGTLVASAENTNESLRPYITVTFEDKPAAKVVAESIPNNPADDLIITLADNIASATASVDGQEVVSEITYSGKSFTLDYNFAASTAYSVSVDITDVNGAKHTKTYTFTTNDGSSKTSTAKIYITEDVHLLSTPDAGETNAWCKNAYAPAGGLLFKAPLSSISVPADKKITKIELNFSCVTGSNRDWNSPLFIYNASTNWDGKTVTADKFKDGTYYPALKDCYDEDMYAYSFGDINNADVTSSVSLAGTTPSDENPVSTTVDITNVFKKAYPTGEVTGDGLLSFYMHTRAKGYEYFTVAMSEHSNEVARPYLTITFSPRISFEASEVLVVDSADDYDVEGFENAVALESVSNGDSIKAICKIINNEPTPKSVVLAIAVYNDDKELVSVSFKTISATAEAVYATDAVTIANNAGFVKAFAWNAADNAPFGDNVEISVQ